MRLFRHPSQVLVIATFAGFILVVNLLTRNPSSSPAPAPAPAVRQEPPPRMAPLFETEGMQCPNKSAPFDGLGKRKRLPQAILIGVMKGGTGAIKHFLLANNYVSVTPYEYHHFSNDQKYSLGLEAYRQQMPESMEDQVTFEGSPGYYPTWKSIRRIYSMNPCVKLITVFIDPVERLISHYAHITAKDLPDAYVNGVKSTSFHNYYFDINGDIRERATGISEGMYGIHMERWLNYFPLERIHVVDGAVLKTEPWLEMQKLEQFLDVPIMSKKRKFVYRSDGKVFCHVKIGCLAKSKGRVHPNVSETDKRSLKAMYRGSDDYFFQLIKRKLSWAPVA